MLHYCVWETFVWQWIMLLVWGNERGSCNQVTGLGLGADGLFSDRQRPALHLSSSQINNRRKKWATTARRDWVSVSGYSKCNAIYQCHSRQSMLAKHTVNTHSVHVHIRHAFNWQGHTVRVRDVDSGLKQFSPKNRGGPDWFELIFTLILCPRAPQRFQISCCNKNFKYQSKKLCPLATSTAQKNFWL